VPNEVAPVRTLAVIGAGSMGHGIAQTAALAGIRTILYDIEQSFVDRGLAGIEMGLDRLVSRDRLSADDKVAAMACLSGATDLQAAAGVDAVVEAAPERLEIKQQIFGQLDAICEHAVFLASNTSSISLQEIARPTKRRERVLGLHYFNPPQILPLVEIVIPLTVDPAVVDAAEAFCKVTGKTSIRVKDTPAFVVNRLFVPFALDAIRLLESGVATAEDIDQACQLGVSHKLGPLATADLSGLDVMLDVADAMRNETGDSRWTAPTLLRRLVSAGHLGRKTGRGIFDYSE
jgi:3-hydroxybutyryl-CoA dehydrogenase